MAWPDGTILLVEDDENDVLLLRRAMRTARVQNPLQVASRGEAAMAYLEGAGDFADRERFPFPVLVLLDLKLPGPSGHDVLAWLRGQPGIRRLPVVVLTSSGESEDVNRAFDLGANSYLVKPGSPEGLRDMVRAIDDYWTRNEWPQVRA